VMECTSDGATAPTPATYVTNPLNLPPRSDNEDAWFRHAFAQIRRGHQHSVHGAAFVAVFWQGFGRLFILVRNRDSGAQCVVDTQRPVNPGLLKIWLSKAAHLAA
jgi:hypothetical protein